MRLCRAAACGGVLLRDSWFGGRGRCAVVRGRRAVVLCRAAACGAVRFGGRDYFIIRER